MFAILIHCRAASRGSGSGRTRIDGKVGRRPGSAVSLSLAERTLGRLFEAENVRLDVLQRLNIPRERLLDCGGQRFEGERGRGTLGARPLVVRNARFAANAAKVFFDEFDRAFGARRPLLRRNVIHDDALVVWHRLRLLPVGVFAHTLVGTEHDFLHGRARQVQAGTLAHDARDHLARNFLAVGDQAGVVAHLQRLEECAKCAAGGESRPNQIFEGAAVLQRELHRTRLGLLVLFLLATARGHALHLGRQRDRVAQLFLCP